MAITSSFIYNRVKMVMLGKPYSTSAGITFSSISISASLYASLILEAHTPLRDASTSTNFATVFANRTQDAGKANTSVAQDVLLTGISVTTSNNVTYFNAANIAFASVSTGQSIGGILIYRRFNDDADSMPICLIDIGSPITANGATINVNWDTGVNRIFSLT